MQREKTNTINTERRAVGNASLGAVRRETPHTKVILCAAVKQKTTALPNKTRHLESCDKVNKLILVAFVFKEKDQ